jgi:hypothetical protein
VLTTRNSDTGFSIVPNRLTYLASARSRPSEVILANWAKGNEWRDWFVTGMGVEEIVFSPDAAIRDRLERHLRSLYQLQQQSIYQGLLKPPSAAFQAGTIPLYDQLQEVSIFKRLLANQLSLFYPEMMLDSDEIRSALEGQGGLLDENVLRRMQESGVELGQINAMALERLQEFAATWMNQPEIVVQSGSISTSMAHALLRLNALYRDYFSVPVPALIQLDAEAIPEPDLQLSPANEGDG